MDQERISEKKVALKVPFLYGVLASFFFAFTFILNRSMNLGGGYWLWSACLRYIFMLPILFLLLLKGGTSKKVYGEIKSKPIPWLVWSVIGFVLFYAPLTLGSVYGESWFSAASWQFTIVAGVFLTPLFGKKIPSKNLFLGFVILAGIFLLQFQEAGEVSSSNMWKALLPIVIAAFCYPLGNRKTMELCGGRLTTIQRVYGMTLCSMPVWLLLSLFAFVRSGLPSKEQVIQSLGVAVFSGVIATLLFFKATDMVKDHPKQLAFIEATQCGEVIFTLLGGVLLLHDSLPTVVGGVGILLIIVGMVLNSVVAQS